MFHRTDDLRIDELRPLIPPAILMEELPLTEAASTLVWRSRSDSVNHAAIRCCHFSCRLEPVTPDRRGL